VSKVDPNDMINQGARIRKVKVEKQKKSTELFNVSAGWISMGIGQDFISLKNKNIRDVEALDLEKLSLSE